MGLKTERRTIDGLEIEVTQFSALRGLEMAARTARAYAPVLVSGGKADAAGVAVLFSEMAPGELRSLVGDLLASSTARHEGKLVALDSEERIARVFEGRLPALLKAAAFAAEVNFGDFFVLAPAPANEVAGAAESG